MYKVTTETKGKKTIIQEIVCTKTEEAIEPLFLDYTCPEDYEQANVIGVEPMTAKEPLNGDELDKMLDSTEYIAEEKLDGTRCTMHLLNGHNRLFSRRISKKTDWYAENSDSVPHLRDLEIPKYLHGTIIDGEMRIDGQEFKEVSSTLNCKWDEAIYRQTTLGYITFHAFDIIYYQGVYVAKMPLERRKELLKEVVKELDNQYVQEEKYTDDLMWVKITPTLKDYLLNNEHEFENKYPDLYGCLAFTFRPNEVWEGLNKDIALPKRAWYEYILLHGGEGMMLKSKKGTYKHTRGREYTKWKKFDTWDVVIIGFVDPTEEYEGKELDTWQYWGMYRQGNLVEIIEGEEPSPWTRDHHVEPVTKHFAKGWVGTVRYGVIITQEELEHLKKINPKGTKFVTQSICGTLYLEVGDCSGMDESTREYMTDNQANLIGKVIEVGANELLKTGKLRHPRFIRFREDKEAERCIWKDHLR